MTMEPTRPGAEPEPTEPETPPELASEPVPAPGAPPPPMSSAPEPVPAPPAPIPAAPVAAAPPAAPPAQAWQAPAEPAGPFPGVQVRRPRQAPASRSSSTSPVILGIGVLIAIVFGSWPPSSPRWASTSWPRPPCSRLVIGFFAVYLVYWPVLLDEERPDARHADRRRLRVVMDKDGGPITVGPAILRLIGYWIDSLVFYLGFIWILIDSRRRGWHDLIAGTVVVQDE